MKRGFFNIITGVINQVVAIILGLILPRLFLLDFGSNMNGLITTINQVFVYFTLFEAGVLAVALQALYGPVARDDKKEINGIIAAMHKFCKRIGLVYGIAMVGFALLLPFIVDAEIPAYQVAILVLLQGSSSMLNYFFMATSRCLMTAEGKEYIINSLIMFYNIVASILRIVFILMGCNVLIVQSAFIIVSVVQLIILNIYVKKHYKWIDYSEHPNMEALSQKNFALIHQISSLIFNYTDTIIISTLLGLAMASVYSIYNMVFVALYSLIMSVMSGVQYKLGQLFNINRKRYVMMLDCCETYYLAIVFTVFTVAYILITPFIILYTEGITDVQYVDQYLPILFVIMNLLSAGRGMTNATIIFAGHFQETKWRAIAESAINLTVSLIAVQFIGIYGVLVGTIAALLYRTNDIIIYSNKRILYRSPFKTYTRWLENIVLFIIIVVIVNIIKIDISNWGWFVLYGVITLVVVFVIYFGYAALIDRHSFAIFKERYKPILKSILHK